jgi:molybdenum cofactor synthesis domain-containing protein
MVCPEEKTVALVIVGNEILSAKIPDENTPFLLQRMRALGVRTRQVVVVPDQVDLLVEALQRSLQLATWVISTGGIGPTHDDITVEAVARALGRELRESPELTTIIREFYRGQVTEAHLSMAMIPEGARLVPTDTQVFPVLAIENLYILPGSPGLMRAQFLGIQERFRCSDFILRKIFLKLEEGLLAEAMARVDQDFPGVEVGSYPIWGTPDHDLVVTLEGRCLDEVEEATRVLREKLPEGSLVKVGGP